MFMQAIQEVLERVVLMLAHYQQEYDKHLTPNILIITKLDINHSC
jgi:hypothetical protein